MKKLNNKGITLVEIIVTITLISLISLFLFRILTSVKSDDVLDKNYSKLNVIKADIINEIQKGFNDERMNFNFISYTMTAGIKHYYVQTENVIKNMQNLISSIKSKYYNKLPDGYNFDHITNVNDKGNLIEISFKIMKNGKEFDEINTIYYYNETELLNEFNNGDANINTAPRIKNIDGTTNNILYDNFHDDQSKTNFDIYVSSGSSGIYIYTDNDVELFSQNKVEETSYPLNKRWGLRYTIPQTISLALSKNNCVAIYKINIKEAINEQIEKITNNTFTPETYVGKGITNINANNTTITIDYKVSSSGNGSIFVYPTSGYYVGDVKDNYYSTPTCSTTNFSSIGISNCSPGNKITKYIPYCKKDNSTKGYFQVVINCQ